MLDKSNGFTSYNSIAMNREAASTPLSPMAAKVGGRGVH
jgi:hypothetical protein